MKTTLSLILLSIVIGFTAGWLIKGQPQNSKLESESSEMARPSSRVTAASQPLQDDAPRPSKREKREPKVVVYGGDLEKETNPEMKRKLEKMKANHDERVKKRFKDRLDSKITDMVKELNLNAEQAKALRAFYGDYFDDINMSNLGSLMKDKEKMKETAALLRGDGLGEYMEDHLSPDQLESFNAMQERKKENEIESLALKDLAKFQKSLDLNQDQKDAMYDLLIEDAEKKLAERSDQEVVMNAIMPGIGDVISQVGQGLNLGKLGQKTEAQQKEIDDQVQRMSTVLNESQLEKYRENLESQSPSGLIQGGEVQSISILPPE